MNRLEKAALTGAATYGLIKFREEIAANSNQLVLGDRYAEMQSTEVARAFYGFSHFGVASISRILFDYRVVGDENIPKNGPAVLASNHLSGADTVFGPSAVPDRHVVVVGREGVMNSESFLGKLQGNLFRAWGAVAIPRPAHGQPFDRKSLSVVREPLERGQLEWLFANGTRTPGKRPGMPKRGAIDSAAKTGSLIVPTVIKGSDRVGKGEGGVTVMFGSPWEASSNRREQKEQQIYLMEIQQEMFDSIPHGFNYADPDPDDEIMPPDQT